MLLYLARISRVDDAVGFALLANLMALASGALTACLVATYFSAEVQGYYYTFGSLISLHCILELGLGQVIVQFVSHEWAGLRIDAAGQVVGDRNCLLRLIGLSRFALGWYGICAALVLVSLWPAGYLFFRVSQGGSVNWWSPWLVLCIGVGLNVFLAPMFYVLQGCNLVGKFWHYRLVQQTINGISTWIAILLGAKLWTMPFATFLGLIWSCYFLLSQPRGIVGLFIAERPGAVIDWRCQVWPLQWRAAISWLSTYVLGAAFTPIVFYSSGPVAAGQMGLTVTLSVLLLAISSSWIVTKAPRFGVLAAERKHEELGELFRQSARISIGVAFLGAGAIWSVVYLLYLSGEDLGQRLLPPLPTASLLLAAAVTSGTSSVAAYLRAYKREPLTIVNVVKAILVLATALHLGERFGPSGVAGGNLAVVLLFEVPASLLIFWRWRSRCRDSRIGGASMPPDLPGERLAALPTTRE